MFSCLRGCFYKVEPHNHKLLKQNRIFEFGHGSKILTWNLAMVAGLVAGEQVTCILLFPPMLVRACFHYCAGGKLHAVLNFGLALAVAYFGFMPFPELPPVEWTPAAIWMTIITILTILPALIALMGGKVSDALYNAKPYLKKQFLDEPETLLSDVGSGEEAKGYALLSDAGSREEAADYRRARELAWGGNLLGAACGMAAAIISGGAKDLCLLLVLPIASNGYVHWLQREVHEDEKQGAIFCWIVAAVTFGFGITC